MAATTNDEILIDMVRERSFLYNTSLREYRNSKLRDNGWNTIGKAIGCTGKEAKARFTSLREKFNRVSKANEAKMKSGAPASDMDNWPLYSRLLWVKDHIRQRRGGGYVPENEEAPIHIRYSDALPESHTDSYQLVTVMESSIDEMQETLTDGSPASQMPSPCSTPTHLSSTFPTPSRGPPGKKRRQDNDQEILAMMRTVRDVVSSKPVQPSVDNEGVCPSKLFLLSHHQRLKSLSKKSQAQVRMKIEQVMYAAESGEFE